MGCEHCQVIRILCDITNDFFLEKYIIYMFSILLLSIHCQYFELNFLGHLQCDQLVGKSTDAPPTCPFKHIPKPIKREVQGLKSRGGKSSRRSYLTSYL